MSAARTRRAKATAGSDAGTGTTNAATGAAQARAARTGPAFTEPLESGIMGNTLTAAQTAILRKGGDIDLHDRRTGLNLTVTASTRTSQGIRMLGIRRIGVPPDVNTSVIRTSSDIRAIMRAHTVTAHPADISTQKGQPS